jgi:predicted amidohydrolase
MYIACCQFDIAWENKVANFEKVRDLVTAAKLPAGSLLLLPEMFATGFSMNVEAIHEGPTPESLRLLSERGFQGRCTRPFATETYLSTLAKERAISVLGGLVKATLYELPAKADVPEPLFKGVNQAVAFGPDGGQIARYTKLHPFSYAGETEHYESGEEVVTFPWGGFTVAPFICYDLRFPEAFRKATLRGSQLFCVIANWPKRREAHWLTLLKARAIENQAYVAAVNRCGSDPQLEYGGRSLIIDPRGEVLADAGDKEGVIGAELDLQSLLEYRKEFPALKDIREGFGL